MPYVTKCRAFFTMSAGIELALGPQHVLPFPGKLFPGALVIGDLDSDAYHDNEIAVGSLEGNLAVFKGRGLTLTSPRGISVATNADNPSTGVALGSGSIGQQQQQLLPWRTARDLGTITCLAIGDVRNC